MNQLHDQAAISTWLGQLPPGNGGVPPTDGFRDAWQRVIDELPDLLKLREEFELEGLIAPSEAIISLACDVARACRDQGMPPPLRAVPDGGGGVSFEHKDGDHFEMIEVGSDGQCEKLIFKNSRLVSRHRLG